MLRVRLMCQVSAVAASIVLGVQAWAVPIGSGAFTGGPNEVLVDFESSFTFGDLANDSTNVSMSNTGSLGTPGTLPDDDYFTAFTGDSGTVVSNAAGTVSAGQVTIFFDASLGVQKFGMLLSTVTSSAAYIDSDYVVTAYNGDNQIPANAIETTSGDILDETPGGPTTNRGEFVGLSVSQVITSVVIDFNTVDPGNEATHFLLIDDLQYEVIPEPASLALLGIGGLLMMVRCRKH